MPDRVRPCTPRFRRSCARLRGRRADGERDVSRAATARAPRFFSAGALALQRSVSSGLDSIRTSLVNATLARATALQPKTDLLKSLRLCTAEGIMAMPIV